MAAPALVKTWFTRGEILFPDTTTADNIASSRVWLLKSILCDQLTSGTTSGSRNPNSIWSVVSSSNGTVANLSDNWTSPTFTAGDFVRAANGAPHSWIVLQNTSFGVWMCIDLNTATATQLHITFSRTAFSTTGLVTTTRPTSTNGFTPGSVALPIATTQISYGADATLSSNLRGCMALSDIGEFFFYTNRPGTGVFESLIFCCDAVNVHPSDLHKTWAGTHSLTSGRGAGSSTTLGTAGQTQGRTFDIVSNVASTNSSVLGGGSNVGYGGAKAAGLETFDALKNAYNAIPFDLVTLNTSGLGAYRGRIPDMWVTGGTIGASFPSTATPQLVLVGDTLVPCGIVVTM